MRNITKFIALGFTCILASCASDRPAEPETTTTVTEVEVVRVETKAPENSTEVTFGKDGATLKTKDGDNDTKIEIKGGSAEVEIKKK